MARRAARSLRWWVVFLAVLAVVGVLGWKAARERAAMRQPAVVLQDAGGTILLDVSGKLKAPPAVPAGERAALAQVLKDGKIPMAALPADLLAEPGTLRRRSTTDESWPVSPLRNVIFSDRPEFRWKATPDADFYEITVFDTESHEIDSSGKISTTTWTPVRPLPRGALYQWQIVAWQGDKAVRAPAPPEAAAKFRVLDAQIAARIEKTRHAQPPSHLLAAVLCARAGLRTETLEELKALAAANPQSKLVQKWLAEVKQPGAR
jgi:hypothetical protein